MGFFSNLFGKKQCSICGKEMGMLERKELKDGNICNDCASKLSPWFEERKQSTIEQIKEQLAYREANRHEVTAFHATRTIGRYVKVCIDENSRKFFVSQESDLFRENPDIIDIGQITNISLDTQKYEHELYDKDAEGHSVSYNPRRYDYSFEFYVDIMTNHLYAKHIRFKLNDSSVWVKYGQFGGVGVVQPTASDAVSGLLGAVVQGIGNAMAQQNVSGAMSPFGSEYQQYVQMGEDIKSTLMRLRNSNLQMASMAANSPVQTFTFDSMTNPIGGRRLFAYKIVSPVSGVSYQNIFLNAVFSYRVFDSQRFQVAGHNFMAAAVNGLALVLQKGLPFAPEELRKHDSLLASSFMQTDVANEIRSCGAEIVAIKIVNFIPENLQQGMMQQNQQVKQVGGQWFCQNCGAPNVGAGKFCENCGSPR